MKILPLVFICCALLSPAQTSLERGKQIVDQALAALGGDHYLAMRDRVESGRAYSFYREELSGLSIATVYTRYLTRPEPPVPGFIGVREREAFGKKEDSAVLFVDGKGYEITFRGARPLPDAMLERFKDSTLRNIFYILRMRLGEPGLVFDSKGSDIVDNEPVDIVEIIDADNRSVTVQFNRLTHLPSRQVFRRFNPETKYRDEEVAIFSKFRDVGDGVMWPFTMRRERNGEKIFEMFADSVTINRDLKDDLFTLPADMKILKKAK